MDEATFFKFGKCVDCSKSRTRGKYSPGNSHLCHVTTFEILNSLSISGMDEAVVFKFGKWIDYSKSYPGVKIPPKAHYLHHVTPFKILNPINISGMDEATLTYKLLTLHN